MRLDNAESVMLRQVHSCPESALASRRRDVGGIMFGLAFGAGRRAGAVRRHALQCSVSASNLLVLSSLAMESAPAQTTSADEQKNLPEIRIAAPRKRPPGRASRPSAGTAT